MNIILRSLMLALLLVVAGLWPATLQAQTSITRTTLSQAISAGQGQPSSIDIVVASATGIQVNGILWIEGSIYRVQAVNGTTITVINQWAPASHLTSAGVYVVPVGAQYTVDPTGSCIRGTGGAFPLYSPYTIHFNVANGNMATCRGVEGSRTWVLTRFIVPQASADPPQTP